MSFRLLEKNILEVPSLQRAFYPEIIFIIKNNIPKLIIFLNKKFVFLLGKHGSSDHKLNYIQDKIRFLIINMILFMKEIRKTVF